MNDRKDPKTNRLERPVEEKTPAEEREPSSYYYDDSTGYETFDPEDENGEEA